MDKLMKGDNDDNLNFSNYMSSQGSDFITGKHGRRIKRFASIQPVAEIPKTLKRDYKSIIKDIEKDQAD